MASNISIYKSPNTVIARFVARRTVKSASLWALVFGIYMAQKTLGFAKIAPNSAARQKLASSFSNNPGLNALLGTPHHVDTLAGYANWNTLGVITIVVSIWSFLLATKYFRGEEENGRSELMLSGQAGARLAAFNTLAGLFSSLVIMFLVTAATFVYIGRLPELQFSVSGSIFFALASVSGAAMFLAIGALTSQLMPTRSRASMLAAAIFGVFFLIRAMGDITSLHWMLYISPLGWIEMLQPLVGSRPVWFLPIAVFAIVLASLSIWIAGRRDLEASIFPDRDTAKPHYKMLNSAFLATMRLTRSSTIGWMTGVLLLAVFYGSATKLAVQAIEQAGKYAESGQKLLKVPHFNMGTLYLSIIYLILMAVIMAYASSASGKIRDEESSGFLDNFIVRPLSRYKWLGGRVLLSIIYAAVACMLGGLGVWAGQAIVHNGASFNSLFLAGINMIAPVMFTLGCGIFAFGYVPRLTTLVSYGVLGWSFIISILSSGLNFNHWFLDTSVLHQVSLAPASGPNWTVDYRIALLGVLLCILGAVRFNKRDLQAE